MTARLTTTQLLELVGSPQADAQWRGRVTFLRHQRSQAVGLADEVAMLDGLLAAGPAAAAPGYRNPTRLGVKLKDKPTALTPADLAWLERLPRDPEQISDIDARELAGMAQQVPFGSPDARLVRSIFEPVQRLHDRRQAAAELAGLQSVPPVTVPALTGALLTAAVLAETPALTAAEANARADAMLTDTVRGAQARRGDLLAQAQAQAAERTDTTVGTAAGAA